jgi:hypothetical protein
VFVNLLSFSVKLSVFFITLVVFLYSISILASINFSSAFSAGAEVFYRTGFTSRSSVFLEQIATFLRPTCFLVPSSCGGQRLPLRTGVGVLFFIINKIRYKIIGLGTVFIALESQEQHQRLYRR